MAIFVFGVIILPPSKSLSDQDCVQRCLDVHLVLSFYNFYETYLTWWSWKCDRFLFLSSDVKCALEH